MPIKRDRLLLRSGKLTAEQYQEISEIVAQGNAAVAAAYVQNRFSNTEALRQPEEVPSLQMSDVHSCDISDAEPTNPQITKLRKSSTNLHDETIVDALTGLRWLTLEEVLIDYP